jgi:hypothetical protein
VLNQHKSHASDGRGGNGPEKQFISGQAASRSAKSNDGEGAVHTARAGQITFRIAAILKVPWMFCRWLEAMKLLSRISVCSVSQDLCVLPDTAVNHAAIGFFGAKSALQLFIL